MRHSACLVLALAAVGGTCQGLPTLGDPQPVDFNVQSIDWHPRGQSLIYTRKAGESTEIGSFLLGHSEGKRLIKLSKGDWADTTWFAGKPNALVTVNRPFVDKGVENLRIEVHLVDLENGLDRVVFDRSIPKAESPYIRVDTSPNLLHAVFRLHTGKSNHYFVLKTGSFDVIPSPDLDAAEKQGISGPSWSVDGTGVFGQGQGNQDDAIRLAQKRQLDEANYAKAKEQGIATTGVALTNVQSEQDQRKEKRLAELNLVIESKVKHINGRSATPAVGATVLELMPQNATLRQVRFKGLWSEFASPASDIASQPVPVFISFGRSKAQSNSIWLTRQKDSAASGVLVTPNAQKAWLSPQSRAIAYVTDGALFIRSMKSP